MKMSSNRLSCRAVALATLLAAGFAGSALGADASQGIEDLLATAQKEKKGVTLSVSGQTMGGGVVKIEPGKWVELRNQQFGRIVVRIDRIDSAAMP